MYRVITINCRSSGWNGKYWSPPQVICNPSVSDVWPHILGIPGTSTFELALNKSLGLSNVKYFLICLKAWSLSWSVRYKFLICVFDLKGFFNGYSWWLNFRRLLNIQFLDTFQTILFPKYHKLKLWGVMLIILA